MALSGPFIIKVGVPYMEVPFCHTCLWWGKDGVLEVVNRRDGALHLFGVCHKLTELQSKRLDSIAEEVFTQPEFGCVEHEPREGHNEGTNDPT